MMMIGTDRIIFLLTVCLLLILVLVLEPVFERAVIREIRFWNYVRWLIVLWYIGLSFYHIQDFKIDSVWFRTTPLSFVLTWISLGLFFLLFLLLWQSGVVILRDDTCLLLILIFCTDIVFFCNNFLLLYLILEIITIIFYTISATQRLNILAGLNYSVFSLFASSFFLISMVIFYWLFETLTFSTIFLGSLSFNDLWVSDRLLLYLAYIFCFGSLLMKIGAAPFHQWAVRTYGQMSSFAFILVITLTKPLFLGVFLKLAIDVFFFDANVKILFFVLAICSIFFGTLGVLYTTLIKELLTYSGIMVVGYFLFGISCGSDLNIIIAYAYLVYYVFLVICFIFLLLIISPNRFKGGTNPTLLIHVFELSGLLYVQSFIAFGFLVILFSFMGLPPLFAFFFKIYLTSSLFYAHAFVSCLLILLSSAIAGFYGLRMVIYILYFDPIDVDVDLPVINFRTPTLIQKILVLLLLIVNLFGIFIYGDLFSLFEFYMPWFQLL